MSVIATSSEYSSVLLLAEGIVVDIKVMLQKADEMELFRALAFLDSELPAITGMCGSCTDKIMADYRYNRNVVTVAYIEQKKIMCTLMGSH
ncbi:hypothetical protein CWC05_03695 [Pseudoalteromonas ruthenica]|uniref:Uncharacterized protein n=1 Tax=Pseudoalteromonas ruthenica TaxID=151081 RepID=A0A5S3ZAC3_9GAMM|nr:hypothetical protein CWC05_03695 [Pseudoalteromonas ruthenica]